MRSSLLTLVVCAGAFNIAFGIFHLCFWRLFRWRTELESLSVANRGIMQILNLCLTFAFFALGALFTLAPGATVDTEVGRWVLAAGACFWLLRTLYQPLFFPMRHRLVLSLFVVFAGGTLLHALAAWRAFH